MVPRIRATLPYGRRHDSPRRSVSGAAVGGRRPWVGGRVRVGARLQVRAGARARARARVRARVRAKVRVRVRIRARVRVRGSGVD